MDDSVASLIIDVYDMRYGKDAGEADLVGEGGHGDSLPGARDQGRGSRREVDRVEGATCHVSEQHGLESHAVR